MWALEVGTRHITCPTPIAPHPPNQTSMLAKPSKCRGPILCQSSLCGLAPLHVSVWHRLRKAPFQAGARACSCPAQSSDRTDNAAKYPKSWHSCLIFLLYSNHFFMTQYSTTLEMFALYDLLDKEFLVEDGG